MQRPLDIYRDVMKWLKYASEDLSMDYIGECKSSLYELEEILDGHESVFPAALYQLLTTNVKSAFNTLCVYPERKGSVASLISSTSHQFLPYLENQEKTYSKRIAKLEYIWEIMQAALDQFEFMTSKTCHECIDTRLRARYLKRAFREIMTNEDAMLPEEGGESVTGFVQSMQIAVNRMFGEERLHIL